MVGIVCPFRCRCRAARCCAAGCNDAVRPSSQPHIHTGHTSAQSAGTCVRMPACLQALHTYLDKGAQCGHSRHPSLRRLAMLHSYRSDIRWSGGGAPPEPTWSCSAASCCLMRLKSASLCASSKLLPPPPAKPPAGRLLAWPGTLPGATPAAASPAAACALVAAARELVPRPAPSARA